MTDYKLLTDQGTIGYYQSCEVTEIFLCRKADKAIFNFYTIVAFEERPCTDPSKQHIGEWVPINKEISLGIQQYRLCLTEAEKRFADLKNNHKWSDDGISYSAYPKLKFLSKQYIPANEKSRLNNILKNNFHSGSYILEFFDETKENTEFLLSSDFLKKFNSICSQINERIPIDLSVARDRIGNFIFQFPITIIETSSRALPGWDGVSVNFAWHQQIETPPNCFIEVYSSLDNNMMGATIEEYNKRDSQQITIGNIESISHINIWRTNPIILLSASNGTYLKSFNISASIVNPGARTFEINGTIKVVDTLSSDRNTKKHNIPTYTNHIHSNLYDIERTRLEKSLSFKQYNKCSYDALDDLRSLIKQYGASGVSLWDPFLCPIDIMNTLYYTGTANVPLKAIGSINDSVKSVYQQNGNNADCIIAGYKTEFETPNNNNFGLNLEFRVQHSNHGWPFHDRFLIFPNHDLGHAKVYSLGTSINSYGKSHHILHEVSHPQQVVDAFNELWEQLNHSDCIVWKHP